MAAIHYVHVFTNYSNGLTSRQPLVCDDSEMAKKCVELAGYATEDKQMALQSRVIALANAIDVQVGQGCPSLPLAFLPPPPTHASTAPS